MDLRVLIGLFKDEAIILDDAGGLNIITRVLSTYGRKRQNSEYRSDAMQQRLT